MAEVIVATLNVNFSADTGQTVGGSLKLEIDDREEGLNSGDTSFSPGDDAYFFMFKGDNVTLITPTPERTAGGVTSAGTGTKDIDENITFSNSNSSSLGYPPDGAVTMTWLGRSFTLSGTTLSPNNSIPQLSGSELKMTGNKNAIGVLRCQYQSTGSLWKLSGVPDDITDVLLVAIGTAV